MHLGARYERLHTELGGYSWVVGRRTGAAFAREAAYPDQTDETFDREPWMARSTAGPWAVVFDTDGSIAWGRSHIDGDPILVVLSENVSDGHLAGLRRDGVSYLFGGRDHIDPELALGRLNVLLGLKNLLLEGGGHLNGSFLRADLIDELSLIISPAIDGRSGSPAVFEDAGAGLRPESPTALRLIECRVLDHDAVWLRYRLTHGASR